ncbi:MAG: hypothetical protein JO149_06910, partial [Gammaproteobacteria bacterium]|nr:hypothetical protein [Gammaproteobacteria bacterium]
MNNHENIAYQHHARALVYQHKKLKLYHYESLTEKKFSVPLLIVFATVNR